MFTIEDLAEKINEPKTKDLYKEVYISYTQGQYRATIVMLWTVVVCDLVYKLQYLRDVYNDTIAIELLEEIAKQQKQNPKDPKWENYLLKAIEERTKFINKIEMEHLEYLQKQRNLCAHPIITNENILFKPSKELTRALMRIALDAILLKTPLLSKEYIDMILEDFESRKDDFIILDDIAFGTYLKNKFLNHLNIDQILNLFKLLWRMVFSPHNDREKTNIQVNLKLLQYIFSTYQAQCVEHIKKSEDYYTYDNSEELSKKYFTNFIVSNFQLYKNLSARTKVIFESEHRNFPDNIPFYFITKHNFSEYLDILNQNFENREYRLEYPKKLPLYSTYSIQLKNQAKENEELNSYYDLCINWYSKSGSYDEANILFDVFIKPNYKDFTKEQILKLIELSSKNNQTYARNRSNIDHKIIAHRYMDLDGDIKKLDNYPDWQNMCLESIEVPF